MKLEAVVELWRETLAPEAALAASNLASKLAREEWPTNGKELHAAWMKRARKASVTDVVELMRVSDFKKATTTELLARFTAMEKWEPHPLATRWLVDVLARQTRAPMLAGQKCFRRVFGMLIDHIDRAGAARFESWIGTHVERIDASRYGAEFFDEGIKRVLAKSAERLADARALTSAELAKLEAAGLLVEPAPPPREVTADALVAAVYEAPWDDAPRIVLADFLQQKGDPRGEFIALELLPELTAPQRKQRNALLKAHGKTWFPESLDRILKRDAEYERGFLGRGKLMRLDRTPVELSTLREVELDVAGVPELDHEVFRSVESWRGLSVPERETDATKRWRDHAPLPRVKRLGVRTGFGRAQERIFELVRPPAWPSVTELVIDIHTGIGWDQSTAPMAIDDLVRLGATHFPNVTHIDVRPFARFDRNGNADELFLASEITRELVWDYDVGNLVASRQRWFEWLARRGLPIVIDAPAWVAPLQERVPSVLVRLGKPRPWSSLI